LCDFLVPKHCTLFLAAKSDAARSAGTERGIAHAVIIKSSSYPTILINQSKERMFTS